MSAVLDPPVPVQRKCLIGQLLGPQVLALLERVPRNPQVRALVLKLAGKLPPPECETFEQVKEWIETQCEKLTKPVLTPSPSRRQDDGISLTLQFRDTECGRANYSVNRRGREQFQIGAEDLMELVNEALAAGGGLDEVIELIGNKIDNDAWDECDPAMEDYGDYDYSEHDVSETNDCETSFDRAHLRTAVLTFVRERHPELAAEL